MREKQNKLFFDDCALAIKLESTEDEMIFREDCFPEYKHSVKEFNPQYPYRYLERYKDGGATIIAQSSLDYFYRNIEDVVKEVWPDLIKRTCGRYTAQFLGTFASLDEYLTEDCGVYPMDKLMSLGYDKRELEINPFFFAKDGIVRFHYYQPREFTRDELWKMLNYIDHAGDTKLYKKLR